MIDILPAYAGLALAAFGAASLLPLSSEAVVAGMRLAGHDALALLIVATAANTAGSALNWWFGRWIGRFGDRRWFPVSPAGLARAAGWYRRWGLWTLLFAWLPVVGDPLTVVAGTLKVDLRLFIALVGIGKAARYAALLAAL